MPKVISPEIKQQIIQLSKNNYLRQGEIAKQFGVSRPTVNRLLSKKPRKKAERRNDAGLTCPITGWKYY
jgi:predicted XRE-type DNA-binding protein